MRAVLCVAFEIMLYMLSLYKKQDSIIWSDIATCSFGSHRILLGSSFHPDIMESGRQHDLVMLLLTFIMLFC